MCMLCTSDVNIHEAMVCRWCDKWCCWSCFRTPVGLFMSRLEEGVAESLRDGDQRRPDFSCPACNFERIMRRPPVEGDREDAYLLLCDAQVTIDEFHMDSKSYSRNSQYALRKITRWGRDYAVPLMLAHDLKELEDMGPDHRQLSWYAVDQSRPPERGGVTHETSKKHRGHVWNYYAAMGAPAGGPTSTGRFKGRMNGLRQRLGTEEGTQATVFSDVLIADLVHHFRSLYVDAEGEQKLLMAQVNLAFHAYTQVGARANELFEQEVGMLEKSFCFGEKAKKKGLLPHLEFRATLQTKENRFSKTDILCAFQAMHAPLKTGFWALLVVQHLKKANRAKSKDKVWAHSDGKQWKMGWFWDEHVLPAMRWLQENDAGGLEGEDLEDYGTNSFRRTWRTLAGDTLHTPEVSEDLCERQGRWRTRGRGRVLGRMVSVYYAPRRNQLLMATYWL